jgi:hypothetical protein
VNASMLQLTLLLLCAVSGLVVSVLLMRAWPRLAVPLWAFVMCFIPYWMGLTLKVYVPPTTLIAVVILVSLLPVRGFRLVWADLVPGLLLLVFLLAIAANNADSASGFLLVAEWLPAYVVGRVIATKIDLPYTYAALSLTLAVVAVLALVEFRTGINPFVRLVANNDQYVEWGSLQLRGGVLRAEGAFGQAIPLGAALALGVPFALGSRMRTWLKFAVVGVLLAGTVVTFSRIGMSCAVLGLLLCAFFLRGSLSTRVRVALVGVLAVAVVAALPLLEQVFTSAGSEATNSAAYRGGLLTTVDSMNIFGVASSYQRTPAGDVYFDGFKSIDSALIFAGLNLGLAAMVIGLLGLAAAIVVVLLRRATPATIAVVAQIPALTSVALITQYASFFWFTVGMAATSQALLHGRRRRQGASPPEAEPVPAADGVHELTRA